MVKMTHRQMNTRKTAETEVTMINSNTEAELEEVQIEEYPREDSAEVQVGRTVPFDGVAEEAVPAGCVPISMIDVNVDDYTVKYEPEGLGGVTRIVGDGTCGLVSVITNRLNDEIDVSIKAEGCASLGDQTAILLESIFVDGANDNGNTDENEPILMTDGGVDVDGEQRDNETIVDIPRNPLKTMMRFSVLRDEAYALGINEEGVFTRLMTARDANRYQLGWHIRIYDLPFSVQSSPPSELWSDYRDEYDSHDEFRNDFDENLDVEIEKAVPDVGERFELKTSDVIVEVTGDRDEQ